MWNGLNLTPEQIAVLEGHDEGNEECITCDFFEEPDPVPLEKPWARCSRCYYSMNVLCALSFIFSYKYIINLAAFAVFKLMLYSCFLLF